MCRSTPERKSIFDAKALSNFLIQGLDSVKKRGKSKPEDKTMVDALEPAAEASKAYLSFSLEEALYAVSVAAKRGMENTKEMVATMGRAKSLGDRALGHPDPGAISTHLIFSFMLEYVGNEQKALYKTECA
jgi:dihydroxyacetone kinase-like protein